MGKQTTTSKEEDGMKKKVQYIQDVKDVKGHTHSLLVYGKNEIYWGNKRFTSMREAKAAIQKSFQ